MCTVLLPPGVNPIVVKHMGRFIMFCMIRTYLNGIVHSDRKIENVFFLQPMLRRVCQEHEYRIYVCRVTVVHTSKFSNCQKKLFSFAVAVNSSIKVGPLVFFL
jgi:hypothetical protein